MDKLMRKKKKEFLYYSLEEILEQTACKGLCTMTNKFEIQIEVKEIEH